MKCLYIDASRRVLALGLLKNDEWFSEEINNDCHTETLLPSLEKLCQMADVAISGLSKVVVVNGPGSFTGLRVSVSAIHALDAVTSLMCLPLDQLSVIAEANNWFGPTVIDARMNEAYIANKRTGAGIYKAINVIAINDLSKVQYLCHNDEREIFPGAACYGSFSLTDVRSLAEKQSQNDWIPASQLMPIYIRHNFPWKPLAEQPSKLYDN